MLQRRQKNKKIEKKQRLRNTMFHNEPQQKILHNIVLPQKPAPITFPFCFN